MKRGPAAPGGRRRGKPEHTEPSQRPCPCHLLLLILITFAAAQRFTLSEQSLSARDLPWPPVTVPLKKEAGQVHFNSHFTDEENVLGS